MKNTLTPKNFGGTKLYVSKFLKNFFGRFSPSVPIKVNEHIINVAKNLT